jgi:hypothetical protein
MTWVSKGVDGVRAGPIWFTSVGFPPRMRPEVPLCAGLGVGDAGYIVDKGGHAGQGNGTGVAPILVNGRLQI